MCRKKQTLRIIRTQLPNGPQLSFVHKADQLRSETCRCLSESSQLSHGKHTIMYPALRGLLQCTPLVLRTQVWGSVSWGTIRQEMGAYQMSLAVVFVHQKQLCVVTSQSTESHLCYWQQIAHHLWRIVTLPYKALIQKFLTGPQT